MSRPEMNLRLGPVDYERIAEMVKGYVDTAYLHRVREDMELKLEVRSEQIGQLRALCARAAKAIEEHCMDGFWDCEALLKELRDASR